MKRVLTALALVPVLIVVIGYAPPFCFLLLVAAAAVLALEEFFALAPRSGLEIFRILGHSSSVLLLGIFWGSPDTHGFHYWCWFYPACCFSRSGFAVATDFRLCCQVWPSPR